MISYLKLFFNSISYLMMVFISLMLPILQVQASSKAVTIFEYHQFPPMVVSKDKEVGLSYGFARYLTKKSKGQYEFEINVTSMQRLQSLLVSDQPAVVLFVNPVWFDDTKMERFLWTDVVLTLKDELVSKKMRPLGLNDESSYAGRVIGGIDGYTYPMLDKLVSENKAHRVNFNNDLEGLRRLNESDDLDALIVNEGPLKFYSDLLGLKQNLYISKQPSGVYPVRILLTNDLIDVHAFLKEVLVDIESDKDWLNLKALYLP